MRLFHGMIFFNFVYTPYHIFIYNRKNGVSSVYKLWTEFQLHSNWENREHQKYFRNVIVLLEKSRKQER